MGARAADRIEELRIAWERDLERTFADAPPSKRRARQPDPGARDRRVELSQSLAPRVHRVARLAAERLGFEEPFVLLMTPRAERAINGQLLFDQTPFAVRLIGPVAGLLDDDALAALVGHEIGHYLAGGPLARPASTIGSAWESGAPESVVRKAYAAGELTADRFSLLACGALEPFVRLDVAIELLDSPAALGVREHAVLDEAVAQAESPGRAAPLTKSGALTRTLRFYAAHLFWRSDVFRDLTGVGPGEIGIRDVDHKLRKFVEEDTPFMEAGAAPRPSTSTVMTADFTGASTSSYGVSPWATVGGARPPAPTPARMHARRSTDMLDAVERGVRTLAKGIRTGLGDGLARRSTGFSSKAANRQTPDDAAEILDDSERRFRELERAADAEERASRPSERVSDDLEARFRELEARFADDAGAGPEKRGDRS